MLLTDCCLLHNCCCYRSTAVQSSCAFRHHLSPRFLPMCVCACRPTRMRRFIVARNNNCSESTCILHFVGFDSIPLHVSIDASRFHSSCSRSKCAYFFAILGSLVPARAHTEVLAVRYLGRGACCCLSVVEVHSGMINWVFGTILLLMSRFCLEIDRWYEIQRVSMWWVARKKQQYHQ